MPRIAARLLLVFLASVIVSAVLVRRPVLANVDLLYFRATSATDVITLEWETASELDNLGFNILRAESGDVSEAQAINPFMIPSQVGGQPTGAYYEWNDEDVDSNTNYFYWLQDVDFNGTVVNHGPVESTLAGGSLIPTVPPANTAQPTATSTRTPQTTPSPTILPTLQIEAAVTESPQTAPSSTPIPITAPLLATASPAQLGQPELAPQAANVSAAAAETGAASAPPTIEPQSRTASGQGAEESGSVPTPIGSDSGEAELITEAVQQTAPDSELVEQSSSDISAQIIGDSSEGHRDSEEVEAENSGNFDSSTALALIVLVAAFLLAIVAGITIWLVLSPKRVDSSNE
jgi:hypothetical protein